MEPSDCNRKAQKCKTEATAKQCHNYRRKILIKNEKLKNYFKNLRSGQKECNSTLRQGKHLVAMSCYRAALSPLS